MDALQDGVEVGIAERERAGELLPALQARLTAELTAEGVDPSDACAAEDDSLADSDAIPETGCANNRQVFVTSCITCLCHVCGSGVYCV